jgi:hypothetical protein
MAEDQKKRTPAYVPYKTFRNSIQGLDHVPDAIDYSLYKAMNGSTRQFLFGALKFFDLIDGKGAPSNRFRELAAADDAAWKKIMGDLIRAHYSEQQLAALKSGTIATLKNSFGTEIGPSIVSPACRFLISAATEAGIEVSPTVAKGSVGNATPRKKRVKGATPRTGEDNGGGGSDDDAGVGDGETISFPVPIAGKATGRIVVPKDMDDSDLPMFNAMVAAVVAYAKQNASSK